MTNMLLYNQNNFITLLILYSYLNTFIDAFPLYQVFFNGFI